MPLSDDRKITRYEKISYLGQGQFATVFKARDIETGQIVAVKKIKLGTRAEAKDGINRTALREIKILQELSHTNVIGLLDVFGHHSNVSLVFDFMDTDLEVIVRDTNIILTPAHIKSYILMTLQGLEYLHLHWILHRDLKPNNLLIDENGILKIGDFGLAKSFGSPNRINTHQVVTRWYRSPELLFGAKMYGTGVDIWALGCIMAELLLRAPFLAGESDLDQLSKIAQVLGDPNENNWPGIKSLPDYIEFKPQPGTPLSEIFTAVGDDAIHVLSSMLTLFPLKRATSTQALKMPYFKNKPLATHPSQLPSSKPNSGKESQSLYKRRSSSDGMAPMAKRLHFDSSD